MTLAIVAFFCLGYLCIALESVIKVNKAATALIMCAGCWIMFALGGFVDIHELGHAIEANLGEAGTTLFFLMGAMTIVEVVDQHGGFNPVRKLLQSKSKRGLLWKMAFLTAFLSAVLDNLTTSIVMVMILRKLIYDKEARLIFASMIVIAANSGGAFSPIGDVTTIMLWNGSQITATGVIKEIFLPSMISFIIPCAILQYRLHGEVGGMEDSKAELEQTRVGRSQRTTIFCLGVGGLCCVPAFHMLTELPPFMGIIFVLGIVWVATELFYHNVPEDDKHALRVTKMLSRIDISTIMFFLGILMAVGVLAEIGVLRALGEWLDQTIGNHYLVTGTIGVLSSIVDNVPLVAGSMKMYAISSADMVAQNPGLVDMAQDGLFWQLLAYCAGVGGSMLIIGSAAGVVVMGLEKITFGWYMKNITWVAFVGYIAGIAVYFVEKSVLGM